MKVDKKPVQIKKTRWFVSLFIWWVAAVFFYMFVAANQTTHSDQLTDAGVQTVLASAEQAGLPLLERNLQALTRLAQDVGQKQGVINVSIIDHKNKIIAFTNPDQLLTIPSSPLVHKDGASFWTHTFKDGTPAMCFSSDIAFAGTKIGEVLLAMNADGSSNLATVFVVSAVVSLILIMGTLLILDFNGVLPLKKAVLDRFQIWSRRDTDLPDGRDVICPVCGTHKALNRSFLLQANLDRYPVVRPTMKGGDNAYLFFAKGINLREISRRDDLSWLRRQMIRRCADIIKKLAGG